MAYVVTEKCIGCKHTDCAVVCPVSCFHEGANMLVIDPDVCIDCGVCVPECPIGGIAYETDSEAANTLEINRKYSKLWPVIDTKKDPLPTAEEMKDKKNKLEFFDPNPGK